MERGVKNTTQAQCAVMEGNFTRFLGLTFAREEVKLKKRIYPSAVVVIQVADRSAANAEGVRAGDIVMTISIISTTSMQGSEIKDLVNHSICL